MKSSEEIKLLNSFLKLAENPNQIAFRNKWISYLLSGLGWGLVVSSIFGLYNDYQPVKYLVWCAIFGGFLGAYAIFLNASSIQGKIVVQFLKKESIRKRISDLKNDT